jgi:hypothetical protein
MKSITLLYEIKKSLNESGWDNNKMFNLSGGSDAPSHTSLRDFCIAYKMFPEAKEYLKQQLSTAYDNLKILEQAKQEYADIIYKKVSRKNEWFWNDIVEDLFVGPYEKRQRDIIKRNSFLFSNNKKLLNIEKAKAFPITDLMDFNRANMACCIFHTERTPSMHYYPKTNSVYCFSCNTYGDSIKVFQQLNNCTFLEAVKKLS